MRRSKFDGLLRLKLLLLQLLQLLNRKQVLRGEHLLMLLMLLLRCKLFLLLLLRKRWILRCSDRRGLGWRQLLLLLQLHLRLLRWQLLMRARRQWRLRPFRPGLHHSRLLRRFR